MTGKVIIRLQCLDTKRLAARTVKTMFVIHYLLDHPSKQFKRTVEPPKPFAFLTESDQRKSKSQIHANAFDQDIHGVWVYSRQSKYKS